jgi:tetratricopeptide (TPR) repeat protein
MTTLTNIFTVNHTPATVLRVALTIACFGCLLATTADAQEVGDRVVVTANFETKIFKKKVDRVFEGSIHTVISVNGKWCALEDVKGWLPTQYVMNFDMAQKHYDERIKANDADWPALAHRGMIHYENGEYKKAFIDLNESLRANKKNAMTWSNRGIVLNAQGQFKRALIDIDYAIKLQPKFAKAHFNRGVVLSGVSNNEEALKSFDKAIELNPKNPWFYLSRGSAHQANGDADKAEQDYRKAIELNKRIADSYVGLSNIYLAKNELDEAFQWADKAVETQSRNAMALNARGWILYKQDKVDDAMYDLNRAVRYAPRLPIAYNNRGVCHVANKDYEDAIADHNKAIDLSDSAVSRINRGVAYLGNGDFKEAKEDFESAENMAPEFDEVLNASAWFLATCPDGSFRNGSEAVKKAKAACEAGDWKVWYHVETLAAASAEAGNYDDAVKYAKQAADLAETDAEKAKCQELLELFNAKKPYRTQIGTSVAK